MAARPGSRLPARRPGAGYDGIGALRTSVGAFSKLLGAGEHRANGELLSYLFFARQFVDALLAEGAADARRWVEKTHDDSIWQHDPIDYGARHTRGRRRAEHRAP